MNVTRYIRPTGVRYQAVTMGPYDPIPMDDDSVWDAPGTTWTEVTAWGRPSPALRRALEHRTWRRMIVLPKPDSSVSNPASNRSE